MTNKDLIKFIDRIKSYSAFDRIYNTSEVRDWLEWQEDITDKILKINKIQQYHQVVKEIRLQIDLTRSRYLMDEKYESLCNLNKIVDEMERIGIFLEIEVKE
jgi:hypothetical protein